MVILGIRQWLAHSLNFRRHLLSHLCSRWYLGYFCHRCRRYQHMTISRKQILKCTKKLQLYHTFFTSTRSNKDNKMRLFLKYLNIFRLNNKIFKWSEARKIKCCLCPVQILMKFPILQWYLGSEFLRENWVLNVKPSFVTLVLWIFSHPSLSTVGGYTESPPCTSHSRQYVFHILIMYFSASQTERFLNHSICPRNKQSSHEYSYTGFSIEVNFYDSGINFKGEITVPHGK